MIGNILKISVGFICIFFMRVNNDVVIDTNEPTVAVFNQSERNIVNNYIILFEELKSIGFVREDCSLLGVKIFGNEIVLNVSESFIYIGGSYKEKEVINSIVAMGLRDSNIKYVTVLINGEVTDTSEGLNLYRLSKLYDL